MKIAVVHDWLVTYAGSERVLEQILSIWPEADLYCVVDFLEGSDRTFLRSRKPTTTFIQHLPWARTRYRNYLPLMPWAIERLDLSVYDLIISCNHAVAKGARKRPGQLHISYINSPIRYAWDLREEYLSETGLDRGWKGALARWMLNRVQRWDLRNTASVDVLVANSNYIADRIRRCYGRESRVIYPPVNIERFSVRPDKEAFYLTASRLVPYKKVPLIVEAFARMPQRKLVVIGDGPEAPRLRVALARAANVEWLGYQSDSVLADHMQRARAFVFAAEEDFGITPLEAQACGTPVIAFGRGGSLETVCAAESGLPPTGLFFEEQTPEAIVAAVERFEAGHAAFLPEAARAHAEQFSRDRFCRDFSACVQEAFGSLSRAT